ncbi:hypothetical protein [Nonlabens agnitus]|uniref:Uncharacterized protein n=1 Tax=Nonlabens agnitus TaxID=870484 RepID=A0A2S9WSR8_9FLAO|nr:hypothetical protein [Nonlabens agnitus]PRP66499.1 hypothetical protein BST86_05015 [Nonlabens agnitus]
MTIQEFIALINVIIWPSMLLIIILLFRKPMVAAFGRLGAITANASGLSLTFESALEAAQETFGSDLAAGVEKSGPKIGFEKKLRPYEQLVEIKRSIDNTLVELATDCSINVIGKSPSSILTELVQRNIIPPKKSVKMQRLITAIDAAPISISHAQVAQLQQMLDSIQ